MTFRTLACLITYFCYCSNAYSFAPLGGYFIATDNCEAYLSKNKGSNPGYVRVERDRAYELLGANTVNGNYYQIRMRGGANSDLRWVSVDCGKHVVEVSSHLNEALLEQQETQAASANIIAQAQQESPPNKAESSRNVLALSWQPAFCESKPNKPECVLLNDHKLPQSEQQLSIHGLWAQPRGNVYCGVSMDLRQIDERKRWQDIPALDLSDTTRAALNDSMPGAISYLHRHEWIKHGTCHFSPGGAEDYFADTLQLTQEINQSGIAQFLQDNIGRSLATQEIRNQFNSAFGAGTGERVQFHCEGDGDRILLQEITINLAGVIDAESSLSELLLAAEPVSQGCPEGVIDAAGLQ